MKFREFQTGVFDYVLKREKTSGGFGATPFLPPTLEDTYFALKTLQLFNLSIDLNKHITFLLRQKLSDLTFEPIAKFIELLEMFSLPYPLDINNKLFSKATKKLKEHKIKFKELFCLFKIFSFSTGNQEVLQKIKQKTFELLQKTENPTLQDCYYAYKLLGKEFPKDFLSHVLEAQNPDGGFGFYRGTTSYMENCFFACFLLKAFSIAPKSLSKLKEFVWSCRNKDGGFGRTPQGISFLETTYYACWILLTF